MLRSNPKIVMVKAVFLLAFYFGIAPKNWAQSPEQGPSQSGMYNYEKLDSREPAAHLESRVVRKSFEPFQPEYNGSQSEFIQQQYKALLAERKSRNPLERVPRNQFQSYRARARNQAVQSNTAISSYHFQGVSDRYVQKELPSRLVPPAGAKYNRKQVTGSFGLKNSNGKESPIAQPYGGNASGYQRRTMPSTVSQPSSNYRRREMPSTANRGVYRQRDVPQQSAEQLYLDGQVYDSPNRLPPIVSPENSGRAISRPVYYSNLGDSRQPAKSLSPRKKPVQRKLARPVRPTSNQTRGVLKGTTKIPTGFSSEDSMVTRARILIQDVGDPFGQQLDSSDQKDETQTNDPFGESPDGANQDSDGGSFETPPADFGTDDQDQQPTDQGADPFADPPGDFQQQQNMQDPFGQEPNRVRDVDPSPRVPDDIEPAQDFQLPPDRVQREPVLNNPPVPRDDPRRVRNRNRNRTDLPKGPFKQGGWQPTPIQPAPARREFQEIIAAPMISQVPQEYYNQPDLLSGADQPTYFDAAEDFNKSDLYEGISVPRHQQACNDGYDEMFEQRPRLIDRFNLGASRLATNRLSTKLACGSCGLAGGGNCSSGNVGNDVWTDNSSDCFVPSYYVSIFGGYTQMERVNVPSSSLVFTNPPLANDSFTFNDGFGLGITFGQIQGENLRSEIEFAFRHNEADELIQPGVNTLIRSDVDGSSQVYTGMFNLVWDFKPRPIFGSNRPYAGAGIGFAVVDIDSRPINPLSALENQTSFAYQWIAGVSRPVSFRCDAFVEFRYLNADSIFAASGSGPAEFEYATDNIFFGLRAYY